MIDLVSRVALLDRRHWATRESTSGGNLLTGCNRFRKEEIRFKVSRALGSRHSI